MRRLMLLAALAATLLLAACGGDDNESASAPAATSGGAFPVTVEHKFGTTKIPAAPERVATVGFGEDDYAYAFDVEPVAIRTFLGDYDAAARPWIPEGADPVEVGAEEINFEKLAAARPDVILAVYSFIDAPTYKKLSQIAPTVAQPDGPDGTTPWQEQTRIDGRALGQADEADALVADVEGQIEAAAEANPQFEGKTVAVVLPLPEGPYVLETTDARARFFTDLGFANAEKTGQLSAERLDLIDQDVLVILGDRSVLEANPGFKRLDVVKEDRVVDLPLSGDAAGALGFNSPLSLPVALDEILPLLDDAVGDEG